MADRQSFIDTLLDHYERPRNKGALPNAHLTGRAVNPGCGDVVTVSVCLTAEGHIAAMRFDGQGCTISQAAASIVTGKVIGLTLAEVSALDHAFVGDDIGDALASNRRACAELALTALKGATPNGAQQD